MIKIDLNKDGLEAKKKVDPLQSLIEKLKKGAQGKSSKINVDLKGVLWIGVVTAFACLPHLFVSQYQAYVRSEHEFQMRTLGEKEASLKLEIQKYQSFQREMESFEKQKTLIKERLSIVRQLLESRGTPVNVLDSIAQSLPQKTWLNSIDFKSAPEPQVNLQGQAYTNEEVSDFVDKLSESIHLAEVTLDSVQSSKSEKDLETKSFQVNLVPKGNFPGSQPAVNRVTANAPVQNPNSNPSPNSNPTTAPMPGAGGVE